MIGPALQLERNGRGIIISETLEVLDKISGLGVQNTPPDAFKKIVNDVDSGPVLVVLTFLFHVI